MRLKFKGETIFTTFNHPAMRILSLIFHVLHFFERHCCILKRMEVLLPLVRKPTSNRSAMTAESLQVDRLPGWALQTLCMLTAYGAFWWIDQCSWVFQTVSLFSPSFCPKVLCLGPMWFNVCNPVSNTVTMHLRCGGNVPHSARNVCIDHLRAVSVEAHDYIHGSNCFLLVSICRLIEVN